MEKYTELDILKAEAEIKCHEAKLTAMKQKREVYRDYEARIAKGVNQDSAYDDLMREYDRIHGAFNRKIAEIETQLARDARHAYDNRDEFWGLDWIFNLPAHEGFVDKPTPPTIEKLSDSLGDTNRLVEAIARRVGVFDERDICRCKCKCGDEQPKTKADDSPITEHFDNREGSGYTIFEF